MKMVCKRHGWLIANKVMSEQGIARSLERMIENKEREHNILVTDDGCLYIGI